MPIKQVKSAVTLLNIIQKVSPSNDSRRSSQDQPDFLQTFLTVKMSG